MLSRLTALFFLAFALVKTLLQRVGTKRSLVAFARHYRGEGISAVASQEAKILGRAGACTACGRCDAYEGERVANSRSGYRGMMAFALAGARSLPDYGYTAVTIAEVPEDAFQKAAQECPENVPLLQLAQLVRNHASQRQA